MKVELKTWFIVLFLVVILVGGIFFNKSCGQVSKLVEEAKADNAEIKSGIIVTEKLKKTNLKLTEEVASLTEAKTTQKKELDKSAGNMKALNEELDKARETIEVNGKKKEVPKVKSKEDCQSKLEDCNEKSKKLIIDLEKYDGIDLKKTEENKKLVVNQALTIKSQEVSIKTATTKLEEWQKKAQRYASKWSLAFHVGWPIGVPGMDFEKPFNSMQLSIGISREIVKLKLPSFKSIFKKRVQ